MIMSNNIYQLQISYSSDDQLNKISALLNTAPTKQMASLWCLEIEEHENKAYFDFINRFLDILEGKYEQLKSIGILRKDISVWFLYEYESQCNIEFDPNCLKRLGTEGINLCLSCWQKGSVIEF